MDGHPAIASCFIETKFLIHFDHAFSKSPINAEKHLASSLLRHLEESPESWKRAYQAIDPAGFKRAYFESLEQFDSNQSGHYLQAYVAACAMSTALDLQQVKYWTEKTPFNEQFVDRVVRIWPNAKFIHMVRDPRDVYTTIRNRSKNSLKVRTTAHNWNRSMAYADANIRKLGADRYMTMNYEELASGASGCMQRVADFLQIPFKPELLQPSGLNGTFEWHGNQGSRKFTGVSASSVGKYQRECARPEIVLIEGLCQKWMQVFGYDRDINPTWQERLKVAIENCLIALKRFRQLFKDHPRGAY